MSRSSGRIDIRATALEPIHHGAGSSGNTQLLRMQEIVLEDGTPARVPFVSGNSIKHRIRVHAMQYALDVLGVADGSLTKAEVDLLFSGGRLSKSGSAVDLEAARAIERLLPPLSMCGYSAGNVMTESKLRVAHLHLVCSENAWRLPADLGAAPHAALRAGALRGEEFGTRHDKAGSLMAGRYLTAGDKAKEAEVKGAKLKVAGKTLKLDSAQMIYDFQVILPGAQFFGSVDFLDLTELELAALASAFYYATPAQRDRVRMSVGGKASVGFGSLSVELRGSVRAAAAEHVASTEIVGPEQADRASAYAEHLRSHREEILSTVREASA